MTGELTDQRPAESFDQDGVPVSWYCTACTTELGARQDDPFQDLGKPNETCPKCGSNDLAWEPCGGEISFGRWFPHDADGRRYTEHADAGPWGD